MTQAIAQQEAAGVAIPDRPGEEGAAPDVTAQDTTEVVPLRHPWTWAASAAVAIIALMVAASVSTNPGFRWPVVAEYMLDGQILTGLARTLGLTVAAMAIGLVLGTLLAVMRLSHNPLLSTMSWLYIWFFRSVPVLVHIVSVLSAGQHYLEHRYRQR
ncbi:MAG: ABC transporter permease subunit [Roseomonas mucosa]|nr:ABC transporter permease subunit [Roseomonas mucosa]